MMMRTIMNATIMWVAAAGVPVQAAAAGHEGAGEAGGVGRGVFRRRRVGQLLLRHRHRWSSVWLLLMMMMPPPCFAHRRRRCCCCSSGIRHQVLSFPVEKKTVDRNGALPFRERKKGCFLSSIEAGWRPTGERKKNSTLFRVSSDFFDCLSLLPARLFTVRENTREEMLVTFSPSCS